MEDPKKSTGLFKRAGRTIGEGAKDGVQRSTSRWVQFITWWLPVTIIAVVVLGYLGYSVIRVAIPGLELARPTQETPLTSVPFFPPDPGQKSFNSTLPTIAFSQSSFECIVPSESYDSFRMYDGNTYYDVILGSDHYFYYESGEVEIGTVAYGYEESEYTDSLALGAWRNVHQFQNTQNGALALCLDNTGLYGAIVPYNFY